METLGVKSITKFARATDYIPQILSQIQRLFEKGIAYETSDGVYYDISKFKWYGQLSHQKLEELKKHRVEPNPEKRNPGDFSLWKKQKPGEPAWDSPFGKGRPGWHIEDTAITEAFFGPSYEIHGGGVDLIFPHHEAELAQMEAISDKRPMVQIWMHTGFLTVNGRKMSKSLGNFITVNKVLERYSHSAIRYFLLNTHYRAPVDFNESSLEGAKNAVEKLNEFLRRLKSVKGGKENPRVEKIISSSWKAFEKALDDDLDTSKALSTLFSFVKKINHLINKQSLGESDAKKAIEKLYEFDKVLGIIELEAKEEKLTKEQEELIKKREEARARKDWEEADRIRGLLKSQGIILEDTPYGTRWKREE